MDQLSITMSHKLEWRVLTVAELNDWLRNGIDETQPFPFETWLVAVDGVPIARVDAETRILILPQVFGFLATYWNMWTKFGDQDTNGAGISSLESKASTIESSGPT